MLLFVLAANPPNRGEVPADIDRSCHLHVYFVSAVVGHRRCRPPVMRTPRTTDPTLRAWLTNEGSVSHPIGLRLLRRYFRQREGKENDSVFRALEILESSPGR